MAAICDALPEEAVCTVKCRLGVGATEEYDDLAGFVRQVHDGSGGRVKHFIVHARRAILGERLTPDQNRRIPPLRYDLVYRLAADHPHLDITLNGGVLSLAEAREHLARGVRGVMIGRAAFKQPWRVLAEADAEIYGEPARDITRRAVLAQYAEYAERMEATVDPTGFVVSHDRLVKPVMNLFAGDPGGKRFRRAIENARRDGLGAAEAIRRASAAVDDELLDSLPGAAPPNPRGAGGGDGGACSAAPEAGAAGEPGGDGPRDGGDDAERAAA